MSAFGYTAVCVHSEDMYIYADMHMCSVYIAHGSYVVTCTHTLCQCMMCASNTMCVCMYRSLFVLSVLCVHCICVLSVCIYALVGTWVCMFMFSLSASHRYLFSPQSAAECSSLLRTLHGLEQEDMQRSLALHQAEDFAQAHRQLVVFQRNELHSIVYTQIQSAVAKGELRPEVAKMMLQDYSKTQVMLALRLAPAERRFLNLSDLFPSTPKA